MLAKEAHLVPLTADINSLHSHFPGRLSFRSSGGYNLFPIILAAIAADAVGKGGSITVGALYRVGGLEPVSTGKSSHVATGARLTFLRYCHSGGTLCHPPAKFQPLIPFMGCIQRIAAYFHRVLGQYLWGFSPCSTGHPKWISLKSHGNHYASLRLFSCRSFHVCYN